MKMKRIWMLISIMLCSFMTYAAESVDWSYRVKDEGNQNPVLEITAKIRPGYHLYAMDTPKGGSMPLSFKFETDGCKLEGKTVANKKAIVKYSDIFEVNEHFFTGSVIFSQKIKPTSTDYNVEVEIRGQVCRENGECILVNETHRFNGKSSEVKNISKNPETVSETENISSSDNVDSSEEDVNPVNASAETPDNKNFTNKWWANVEAELKSFDNENASETQSLWFIFIAGFLGGLIALVTPCVWPMIPMTVSFFLKQNKSKRKAIGSASLYGVSIIVIYVLLGLFVTMIFGASALNELATSAGFNIAFFILLIIFAISFMGGFELSLPSSWSNKIDSKVDSTTGIMSIFFMAFTLALVSFSCTGPIIGTLLVEAAASSNFVSPAVGMFGFALALALPFSLFAMFPSVLKSIPKSGGWMNTVKVVLGFLELALALKFLSVADLAYNWRILDREVFIALWIVIFALLGLYLLGKLRFPHDDKVDKIGITRFMCALISLSFAIYMLPGLWGAPLKSISAFAPPVTTQDFNLYDGSVHAKTTDFEEGLNISRQNGKPVLLDFSGYGCVNCRKMEASVWTDPKIKSAIDNDFVLVTLMVDDKTPLPSPVTVKEKDGKQRTLKTVGDKWSYLQRSKFGSNAQPFYTVVDGEGIPLSGSYGFNENPDSYLKFLQDAKSRSQNKGK